MFIAASYAIPAAGSSTAPDRQRRFPSTADGNGELITALFRVDDPA